ncbi:hypothetical protein [Maribacter sp. 2308TA10-17]|uniref:hypothetical protein n=1 Tax=Maribacter sp. 2308TA10-17 TaxID=3386276 RepID=UPI0039BCF69C
MTQLKKRKLKTKIPSGFWIAMAIVSLSSLPYLHEAITTFNSGLQKWVPILGIENFLTDNQGKVLGFSTYRMFLYTLFIFLFTEFSWLAWLFVSKRTSYYYALFIPVVMGAYQILIILFNLRKSVANTPEVKLILLLGISLISVLAYLKKNRFNLSTSIIWLSIISISTLPYLHDIITLRDASLRSWVPIIGIESFLTNSDGVGGFWSYRSFVYFLMLHLYAHLGWLGAFIYYGARKKKPRPFLLVPVIISLYSVIIILLNWQETGFNKPNIKFYITLALSALLALNFFFNDKLKIQNKVTRKI